MRPIFVLCALLLWEAAVLVASGERCLQLPTEHGAFANGFVLLVLNAITAAAGR
jgi:hypothetical protein